jgi:hypothetical protein
MPRIERCSPARFGGITTQTPSGDFPNMSILAGQSLEQVRPVVEAFGAASGLPFLKLDDQGSAAVSLKSGARLELEYIPASDRLLAFVEVIGGLPEDSVHWAGVALTNVRLMSAYGFGLGLGKCDGADRLLVMVSLPAANLSEETLGNTLVLLVETARDLGQQLRELPGTPNSPPEKLGMAPDAFRV